MKCRSRLTFLQVLLAFVHITQSINPLLYNKDSDNFFAIDKIECTSNPLIVLFNCTYQPVINQTGNFLLRFDYQKTIDSVTSEVRFYSKAQNKNSYKSTPIKQKVDFCSLTANPNVPNLFSIFLPPDMDRLFPPCPFFGKIELNFTLPPVAIDPKFFRDGGYRLDITFTTNDEVLMWRLKVFGNVKAD